jgi:hypothetical protein
MDTTMFWDEEIGSFPHGGRGAAVWVVRRSGPDPAAPIKLLLSWASGQARTSGLAGQPPLGGLLRTMNQQREELVQLEDGVALWLEPLYNLGEVRGGLAIWFDAGEPWRESIFLWGQRLAARLGPVLGQLAPLPGAAGLNLENLQPTLFPAAELDRGPEGPWPDRLPLANLRVGGDGKLPLPRPLNIPGIPSCVGTSLEMRLLGDRLGPIARSGVNVLLHGESGVGKEIVARALHLLSDRQKGPFIGQNCAALPETLFESELFGHRAGAFTGASGDKQGLLAAASGGTFFLDEIGDMPLPLQIKLLRVMQERRVRRIGDLKSRPVDLRFVAASHKDLEREIREGRFRLDLFYRLKVVRLVIPPCATGPRMWPPCWPSS